MGLYCSDRHAESVKQHLITRSKQLGCQAVAAEVIEHASFYLWSGSAKPEHHHYGKFGLLCHTGEVVDLCLAANAVLPGGERRRQKLFLAALYHDFAKIYDYTPVDQDLLEWRNTQYKYRIRHVVGSYEFWKQMAVKHNLDPDMTADVAHAILAHHGRYEYGSPILPQTKTAVILHQCDNLSAAFAVAGSPQIQRS